MKLSERIAIVTNLCAAQRALVAIDWAGKVLAA